MLSFWEKDEFLKYDFVIIGGGIVGLSTAISIKEKSKNARVLVLERGTFPSGASTKNAGFACFGSLTEILADLKRMTSKEVFDLVKLRWEGLSLLRQRLGDKTIDYQNYGGYEILKEKELNVLDSLGQVNELLFPLFEKQVYQDCSYKIEELGFQKATVKSLIFNPYESQIHTGKMMTGLMTLVRSLDIEVLTGTEVMSFNENESEVEVHTKQGINFRAGKVAVCTNAFSKSLLPDLNLKPGRGVVLITKPINGLKLKGTFHYDEGFYYFRNYQNRILFGGGRNLDVEGETTTKFEIKDLILNKLEQDLKEFILPDHAFEIDSTWAGIMAFGDNKQPILKKHSNNVYLGLRLGGMGVAIGSKMGLELANSMLG